MSTSKKHEQQAEGGLDVAKRLIADLKNELKEVKKELSVQEKRVTGKKKELIR